MKATLNERTPIKIMERMGFEKLSKENILIKVIEAGLADKSEFGRLLKGNITTTALPNGIRKTGKTDELPYFNTIATDSKFKELTVLDVNNDNSTWSYTSIDKCAVYEFNSNNPADDWLITPGIKLEAGKTYAFGTDLKAEFDAYPERFEMKMIKAEDTPTAETINAGTELVPSTVITNDAFQTYGKESFTVGETGYYYFGIHAISDAGRFYLSAKNINVKEFTITSESPEAPELNITAAEKGELKAVVKVTAPTKSVEGNDIGTNLSKIEVYRDDVLVKTFTGVTKGQVLTFDDTENMTHGQHAYFAIPYDAAGKEGTKSEAVSLYIGKAIPDLPMLMTATDMPGKIVFDWDLVTKGVTEGYFDPAKVDYKLYTVTFQTFWGTYYPVLSHEIATVTNKDSYEYSVIDPDDGEQGFKYFGLQTRNEAGANRDFINCSVLVGKPYELPLIEGMADKMFHSAWYNDGKISQTIASPDATDGDGYALNFCLNPEVPKGEGFLSTGKLNLNASVNPILVFDAKRGSANSNLAIYVSKVGGQLVKIADVDLKDEYSTYMFNLKDFKGSRYAQVRFVSYFAAESDNVIMDKIMIRDYNTDDLGITMTAPASVMASGKVAVEVTVENNGANTCDNYTVDFYAGEKKIKSETVTEPLKSFEKKHFTFDYETTIFDEGDVTLKTVVNTEVDLKDDNNKAESIITILQTDVAGPTNLKATEDDGKIVLTWDAPANMDHEVTENFDNEAVFAPFSIGNITKDVHTGYVGDWTLYDGNGMYVYGFQDVKFRNAGEVQAWQVFNPDAISPNWAAMTPKSGKQYMISFCPADEDNLPQADHWLISPMLSGKAQTINFYGKQISTTDASAGASYYGLEKFEIFSTNSIVSNDIATFNKVGEGEISQPEWAQFSFNLPEGAMFFAIRHTSENVFGLMIDDVTFITGGKVISYNIYVDGELYANVDVSKLTALIGNLENGTHTFAVTAVYSNGKESRPVTFVLGTTSIYAVSVDGKPVDIYTIDGKLVRKQATSLEGLRGMYIINNRKIIIK
ncbi:MAG: choice-of-anchor J domain-containing protein [Prevotella sp.]|uniref:choice-of-anchor J domain-containing protein n=1 Tax=Prevotella sp. TaxID=59823 RepID=UPI002A29FD28|nr:choice-of-anchor J domain-containing protein [Prevotella sp.]MDD7317813.1 choice-of-anchor J domain-containing protein [Prevotellaceae bacterium]MDY4020728.1 choice-of-anchor J domain-containing protein [Prevotella sp.]